MEKEPNNRIKELQVVNQCSNLFEFIKIIDINLCQNDENVFFRILLAKSVCVIGEMYDEMNNYQPKIDLTCKAAIDYIHDSSEENWNLFFEYSTNSYPFGPGEGCYAVAETGILNCEPGSGCRSGAGSLSLNEFQNDYIWEKIKFKLLNP